MDAGQAAGLLSAAREAARQAYAPYSDFPVGAALLTESGEIITGCNVENVSYGLTICAERAAVFSAVSQGHRRFKSIAVWAERRPNGAVTPCGACRQVLAEFMPPDGVIIMSDPNEQGIVMQSLLNELLPKAFDSTL